MTSVSLAHIAISIHLFTQWKNKVYSEKSLEEALVSSLLLKVPKLGLYLFLCKSREIPG